MEKHELFIPSAISQSCFYQDGKITIPKPNEFNYFIALLYLFRKNLIFDNTGVDIFIDDEDKRTSKNNQKKILNPDFKNFTVEIELSEFDMLGVVSNNDYTLLKPYLQEKLYYQTIEIDILGTKRLTDTTGIDIVDTITIDDNILEITFTDEFVKMILHCEKYYAIVDIQNVFQFTSHKAQKLYLLAKDYATHPDGYIKVSKEHLEMIIGKIPDKTPRNNLCALITDNTDTNVSIGDPVGNKKKKYTIKMSAKKVATPKKSTTQQRDEELWIKAVEKVKAQIKRGAKIDNEESYTWKTYNNLVETQNKKEANQEGITEAQNILDEIDIQDYAQLLINEYDDVVSIKEYKLFYVFQDNIPPITKNAIETLKVLQRLEKN